jgi:hypothetical protein
MVVEDVVLHLVVVHEPQFAVGAGVRLLVHGSNLSTWDSSPSSVGGIRSAVIVMAPPPVRRDLHRAPLSRSLERPHCSVDGPERTGPYVTTARRVPRCQRGPCRVRACRAVAVARP